MLYITGAETSKICAWKPIKNRKNETYFSVSVFKYWKYRSRLWSIERSGFGFGKPVVSCLKPCPNISFPNLRFFYMAEEKSITLFENVYIRNWNLPGGGGYDQRENGSSIILHTSITILLDFAEILSTEMQFLSRDVLTSLPPRQGWRRCTLRVSCTRASRPATSW